MLSLILLCLLASCALTPPDVPVIMRAGPNQGYYVKIMSGEKAPLDDTNLLDGKTFLDYSIEGIIVPIESYEKLKKFIIDICYKYKCSGDIQWQTSLRNIDQNL